MREVFIKRLPNCHTLPARGSVEAAGYDMYAAEDAILRPGQSSLIHCGFAICMPAGYEAQIRPRSGLALKNRITVLNAPGTVDSDYRGEMCVILINHGHLTYMVHAGDRIAQMVFARHESPVLTEITELPDSERGAGGFGSTGIAKVAKEVDL